MSRRQPSIAEHHAEWINLLEITGPFLSPGVLTKAFPQGLDEHQPEVSQRLRLARAEWEERSAEQEIHQAWVRFVLTDVLEQPADEVLREGQEVPTGLAVEVPEQHERLRPTMVLVEPDGRERAGAARILISVYSPGTDLEHSLPDRHWKETPAGRMAVLLRGTEVRLGLVTNGERWMLVDAPRDGTTGYVSWYADLWLEEPLTLRAFRSLLGPTRLYGVATAETLEGLLAESAQNQQEVTDQLGRQVRRAVEILVQALDAADRQEDGALLKGLPPEQVYEAAVGFMMRLVVLFAAEERRLLPLDDPFYAQHYAASTLYAQLRELADRAGEPLLERRRDAWQRLLATFRAVHGGVEHERLRLPAYGGRLFDPDRYPFLEGRVPGTRWRETPAKPLPIHNRTVLHLLAALQVLEDPKLKTVLNVSFEALDIEQIGHVYEGLLDHTVRRATEPMVSLAVGSQGDEPEVALSELVAKHRGGVKELATWVKDLTGRGTERSLRNMLEAGLPEGERDLFRHACENDEQLLARVVPYAGLIRRDSSDLPVVIHPGALYVTAGTDRRTTGTHYTPRSLTEPIIQNTLEPLVYDGPAEGKPREEWKLKPATVILGLKICDLACGSGAFLVQACRFLAQRLCECWEDAERRNPGRVIVTPEGELADGRPSECVVPSDPQEREVVARRLITDRCLYGVDKNPMAVEMAKLALWLITLDRRRPFEFLDHALRPGDSVLGTWSLAQLERFSLAATARGAQGSAGDDWFPLFGDLGRIFADSISTAIRLRRELESFPTNHSIDQDRKARLFVEVESWTEDLRILGDALVRALIENRGDDVGTIEHFRSYLRMDVDSRCKSRADLRKELEQALETTRYAFGVRSFHWAVEFPEVLNSGGFHAVIGNPPWASYSGRQAQMLPRPTEALFSSSFCTFSGWPALHSLFVERAFQIVRPGGLVGLVLPAQVCDLEGYGEVRSLVRTHGRPRDPFLYFGESAFQGVTQPCFFFLAEKGSAGTKGASDEFRLQRVALEGGHGDPAAASAASEESIRQRLAELPRPPKAAFGDPGVHTGNCSKKLILLKPVPGAAPVREGKDINPFSLGAPKKWIHLHYEKSGQEYFRIGDLGNYRKVPVLLRQTAPRPIAALHSDPTYFRNSVLACYGFDGVEPSLVVAWLNSTVVAWHHLSTVRESGQKAFPQVKIKHLRALPVPDWGRASVRLLTVAARICDGAAHSGDLEDVDRCVSVELYGLPDDEHSLLREQVTRMLA